MKIVFFGTSPFAVSALRKFKESPYSVAAVVTRPDRKSGRHLKISASPVKKEAERLKIPVHQPKDAAGADFIEILKGFRPDFFVVVAYGKILPKSIFEIPRFCCLNIHASLLPKYRGAAPISWVLINGEQKTGVSIIRLNEKMDAGDIVLQEEFAINKDDTSETLNNRLTAIGAGLLIRAIGLIESGKAQFKKQDESQVTLAPKLTKEDGEIDWNMKSVDILNRMRGLKPWPGTYSFLAGHILKIISACSAGRGDFSGFAPGQVIAADEEKGFLVKTGDGAISLSKIQLEGKKEMSAELFLRGHKISAGAKLG